MAIFGVKDLASFPRFSSSVCSGREFFVISGKDFCGSDSVKSVKEHKALAPIRSRLYSSTTRLLMVGAFLSFSATLVLLVLSTQVVQHITQSSHSPGKLLEFYVRPRNLGMISWFTLVWHCNGCITYKLICVIKQWMVSVSDECLIFYIFLLRSMTESTWKILKLD